MGYVSIIATTWDGRQSIICYVAAVIGQLKIQLVCLVWQKCNNSSRLQ